MDEEIDLRKYIWLLRRWLWLIAVCAVAAAIAAFAISAQIKPIYEATATLLVHQAPTPGVSEYTALLTSERLAQTYAQMLTGRPVLGEVIARLALQETPEEIAKRLKIQRIQNTQLIRVRVEGTDPAQAAAIANTLAEVFIEQSQELLLQRYAESLGTLEKQITELSGQIDETEQRLENLGMPETTQEQTERARLEMLLAGYRNTYATLIQSYEQLRLTAAQTADNAILFEAAEVPREPVRPRKLLNATLAGVIGAMLAVGAVFLIEYLDDTVKTPDEVAQLTGLSTLGAIGRMTSEEELVTLRNPLSPVSEAFRLLRTNIRYAGVDRPLRLLLVTSPTPVEGKSFVVANLAVAMAQAGIRVVVVDADLRRPRQHRIFGVHPREGLTGSLLEGTTNGRLQQTEVEGLMLLPGGGRPPNPAELLASRRMRELLEELAGQADVMLIDSPPVLPVADAVELARDVDGVLMVVQAGGTERAALQQAVKALEQVEANVIGVVINFIPTRRGGYYGYYYGYYYHEGYREDSGERKSWRRRLRRKADVRAKPGGEAKENEE